MLRLVLLGVFGSATLAQAATPVERGRYLVEQVGMCGDCHTPRDRTGALMEGAALTGAPIGFAPKFPMPQWGEVAPPIAGIPAHFTESDMARFLETGVRPDGSRPAPPMPPYRMSPEDAAAVAAYLKSLR